MKVGLSSRPNIEFSELSEATDILRVRLETLLTREDMLSHDTIEVNELFDSFRRNPGRSCDVGRSRWFVLVVWSM